MKTRILVNDWKANWLGKRFIRLDKCDESFVRLIRTLERDLPKSFKIKIKGRYNCGYGISMKDEDYDITLKVSKKTSFSRTQFQCELPLKKDLTPYKPYSDQDCSKILEKIIGGLAA